MAKHAARSIIKRMLKKGIDVSKSKIGILGVTFKENCPDIRNTKVIDLVIELEDWGAEVLIEDPWACEKDLLKEYNVKLKNIIDNGKVDSIIIAVGHKEYRALTVEEIKRYLKDPKKAIVADLKSLHSRSKLIEANLDVYRL